MIRRGITLLSLVMTLQKDVSASYYSALMPYSPYISPPFPTPPSEKKVNMMCMMRTKFIDERALLWSCYLFSGTLRLDKIIRLLGQGTFGKVVECFDRDTGKYCAIKIIRAVQKYRDASKIEARVLKTLKQHDPRNEK